MAKILIVEDEANIARFLELELKHEGYEVEKASDGRLGLQKALEGNFDLILLDIMLPGLSGIEVCRRVRMESRVPIIMLTAKDDVTDKEFAKQSIYDKCNSELKEYEVPKYFQIVTELPYTQNGKYDFRLLEKQGNEFVDSQGN